MVVPYIKVISYFCEGFFENTIWEYIFPETNTLLMLQNVTNQLWMTFFGKYK